MGVNQPGYLDAEQIRQAISLLVGNDLVFECRILRNDKSRALSGYFKDAETLIKAFDTVNLRYSNVYITLQQLKKECFNKSQQERFMQGADATNDKLVTGFNWLFIDLDPIRESGIPSSEEEMQEAYKVARAVDKYLHELGFANPIKAISGNGAHLLYRVHLANTEENQNLLHNCLTTLGQIFNNDRIKIDEVNANPSRVCKLYGTLSQKGGSTEDRPYRMSQIIGPIDNIQVNEKALLEKLASQMIVEEKPQPAKYNNYMPSEFNIETWMDEHMIAYKARPWGAKGTRYILDHCPFNHDHKAPDSTIFKFESGALSFRCLHNSCADKTWHDVRVLFEPDAYEKKSQDYDNHIEEGFKRFNRNKKIQYTVTDNEAPMFLRPLDSLDDAEPETEYIPSGITKLDDIMRGLAKKAVSVISGLRGAAKSTLLSMVMLNAIEAGQNVVCYSGELTSRNFWSWLCIQAAGKNHVVRSSKWQNSFTVEEPVRRQILQWMHDHISLYNNNHGNRFSEIAQELITQIGIAKADLVVIDNLMALDLDGSRYDVNQAQTDFVWTLKQIAARCNVHVIFVAHPKKTPGFLRLDDISGSSNIANIVDNAFIIHRINRDFVNRFKEMYKENPEEKFPGATNVVEICKDRENGTQDEFIPLYYETSTKRLRNEPLENTSYGWEHTDEEDDDKLF